MYWHIFVSTASVTPNEMAWLSALAPSEAATPNNPARSKGQHQDPTNAGMEISSVATDAHTPVLSTSDTSRASPSTAATAPLVRLRRGLGAHAVPSHVSSSKGSAIAFSSSRDAIATVAHARAWVSGSSTRALPRSLRSISGPITVYTVLGCSQGSHVVRFSIQPSGFIGRCRPGVVLTIEIF